MSESSGLRITVSKEVSIAELADVIAHGLYHQEIIDLFTRIVKTIKDTDFTYLAMEAVEETLYEE